MPRMFKTVSVIAHVVVVAGALAAELTAIGPLPAPRHPLSFESVIPIRVIDIPKPAPSRGPASSGPASADATSVAPIVAPTTLQREADIAGGGDPSGPTNGVEAGFGSGVGLTAIENVPPPPP